MSDTNMIQPCRICGRIEIRADRTGYVSVHSRDCDLPDKDYVAQSFHGSGPLCQRCVEWLEDAMSRALDEMREERARCMTQLECSQCGKEFKNNRGMVIVDVSRYRPRAVFYEDDDGAHGMCPECLDKSLYEDVGDDEKERSEQ